MGTKWGKRHTVEVFAELILHTNRRNSPYCSKHILRYTVIKNFKKFLKKASVFVVSNV